MSITSAGASTAQPTVTQVDKNADGAMTYHFSIKVGEIETMEPGSGDALPADFVAI